MSKSISVALAAHLASEVTTLATCLKLTRKDTTVVGFTDHPEDIIFDGVTYQAATGYNLADIATACDLNTDNTQVQGMLLSPAITDVDMLAGKWDFAAVSIFRVNYADLTQGKESMRSGRLGKIGVDDRSKFSADINGLTDAYRRVIGRIVTPTCDANLGDSRCKVRVNPPVWQANTGYGVSTGLQDASQGSIVSPTVPNGYVFWCGTAGTSGMTEPTWTLANGGVTTDGTAVWESLPALTVVGTIDGVNSDNVTLYDAGRTEPGPTGGIAITGITNANPTVVTLASAPDPAFTEGQIVSIADVDGMDPLNAVTVVHNPSGNTFELDVDTTDTAAYPPYVSGGTVTPMGGSSGFFDNGTITFTSGLNDGISQDVAYYDVGRITLFLPMPYTVAIGDTYTLVAGCDKSMETCRDRFFNIDNFRGSPYLPGVDKIVQVGRSQ